MPELTHPDIIAAEKTGNTSNARKEPEPEVVGECGYCGKTLYDCFEHVKSLEEDEIFCDMDCCHDYFGIEEV